MKICWIFSAARQLAFVAPLVLVAAAVRSFGAVSPFEDVASALPGLTWAAAAWGDCDGDGDFDLLVGGSTDGSNRLTRLYRNDGGGGFSEIPLGLSGLRSSALAWGDYDGDGDLDFALMGSDGTNNHLRVYRNDSAGEFAALILPSPGVQGGALVWSDFDNDGDLDLAAAGSFDGSTRFFRNEGFDTFADSGMRLPSLDLAALATADYDKDGDLDLAVVGRGSSGVDLGRLYRNNRGRFSSIDSSVTLLPTERSSLAWGDADNDDDLDLLLSGSQIGVQAVPSTQLYRNNRPVATTFTTVSSALPGVQQGNVAWGDFDNDGLPDVVWCGYTAGFLPGAGLHRNLGGGVFTNSGIAFPGVINGCAAWGDIDGDGDLDLALFGNPLGGGAFVGKVYRNTAPAASNPAPSPPGDLTASVVSNSLTLTWTAGSDANQAGGLGYNLRVGRSPGANDILAAMADPMTGRRLLPAPGNVGPSRSWTLTNLASGTYYWSVQTIDHAFTGSAFANESVAVIPAMPPIVRTLGATNVLSTNATLRGTAVANTLDAIAWFEYGTNLALGSRTAAWHIGDGSTPVPVTTVLTGIVPGFTYYYRLVASNSLGMIAGATSNFLARAFVEVNAAFTGLQAYSFAWGDYDADGDFDLALMGYFSPTGYTRVFRNDGGGAFTSVGGVLPGTYSSALAWGDYDRDGDLDLLVAIPERTRIYRYDGSETFTDLNLPLAGYSQGAAAQWLDFDNDGDLDILLLGATSEGLGRLYRNEGAGQFTEISGALPNTTLAHLALGDFNEDGRWDFVLTGNNGAARWYRNAGNGSFSAVAPSPFRNAYDSAAVAGAFGNQPWLDVVLSGYDGTNRFTQRYVNGGLAQFTPEFNSSLPAVSAGELGIGDFNNDGGLDLIVSGETGSNYMTAVLHAGLQNRMASLAAVRGASLGVADYDGDGNLDMVLSGYTGSNWITRLYRNEAVTPNPLPAPPHGLTAVVSNSLMFFRWAHATDANQSGGFSYNLRLGTTPAGGEIMRPMSDLATGRLLVPQLGNAGLGTNWLVAGLELGTYFWSVQAVDHSFAGSAFSTNATLVLAPGSLPPGMRNLRVVGIHATRSELQAEVNPRGIPTVVWVRYGVATNLNFSTSPQAAGSGLDYALVPVTLPSLTSATNYFYQLHASNVAGVTVSQPGAFSSLPQFSTLTNGLPGRALDQGGSAAWGDFDNDGALDIALSGGHNALGLITRIYRGDGTGMFAELGAELPKAWHGSLAWEDFDRDGDLDLTIEGIYDPGGVAILRNNGLAGFAQIGPEFAAGNNLSGVTWADYDNDGDADLFLASEPQSQLWRNDGEAGFVNLGLGFPALAYGAADWADFDHDGDLDLLMTGRSIFITNYYGGLTRLYRNDGEDVFTEIDAGLLPLLYGSVAWGDFDNDGWPDIAVVGKDYDTWQGNLFTKIYRNLGNGAFTEVPAGLPGIGGQIFWADFDNDGALDLLLNGGTSTTSSTRIFFGNGQGHFSEGSLLANYGVRTAAPGDYDNDGDLDLMLDGQLVRNNNPEPNTPPGTPTDLTASVTGNEEMLSWTAPTDAEQSGGLTYNLQVGRTPGGMDVFAPTADGTSGWRRVPRPGVASAPKWKLDLPVGTYYWRVQAIDHALAGSGFSTEESFTVSAQAPRARTLGITTNDGGELVMHGQYSPNGASTVFYFEFGLDETYGNVTPLEASAAGNATFSVSKVVLPWHASMPYHFRLVASNHFGITRGRDMAITVPAFVEMPGRLLSQAATWAMEWGDADNDGDLDVLGPRGLQRNDGGSFTNQTWWLYGVGGDAWSDELAWGDFNGDGWLDIGLNAAPWSGPWPSRILRNDGTNRFISLAGPSEPVGGGPALWADVDNDGDLDFLAGRQAAGTVFFRNDGNGSFTPVLTSLPPVERASLAWGDYDGDGDGDLMLSGLLGSSYLCRLYRNEGGMAFVEAPTAFPGVALGALAWADYDNDGDLDILISGVTNANYDSITRLFRNDGGNVFTDVNAGFPGQNGGGAAWGDYDNDGRLDLLLSGQTNALGDSAIAIIFRNHPDGRFLPAVRLPAYVFTEGRWGDYDGDGRLDLALAKSAATSGSRLFRNISPAFNRTPTPPTVPDATVSNATAFLRWTAASDPNQDAALTYNVRISRTPDGEEIMPAMSDFMSGRRRLPQPGNIGPRLFAIVNGLSAGTYFWAVQAVDHSYAGSPFTPPASFVETNLADLPINDPPQAFGLAVNTLEDTPLPLTLVGYDPERLELTFAILAMPTNGTLSGVPPNVTYAPLTNFFGQDRFTFYASDGLLTSSPATVLVNVLPVVDTPATVLSLRFVSGLSYVLRLAGEPWTRYRIEVSSDLRHWSPLATAAASAEGELAVTDSNPVDSQRFYRAQPLP